MADTTDRSLVGYSNRLAASRGYPGGHGRLAEVFDSVTMWTTRTWPDAIPSSRSTPPRQHASRLLALALLALSFVAVAPVAAQPTTVQAVRAVGLTVSDLDRSVALYTEVLAFEKTAEVEVSGSDVDRLQGIFGVRMRTARLQLGEEAIELTEYVAPRGRPVSAGARSNDRWFQHIAIIVSDMDRAYARLREYGVEHVSPEPQRLPDWNPSAGGIEAFYFKDPDGHPLEILAFPAGKGDPKWHRASDRLFLGIDHTAIVVADTETSLRFYRDRFGFSVAGESLNHGIEQERLNHVFGARLRITGLRVTRGPGIELLEYLSPRDGRPMPRDERANDLVHWQTQLLVSDVEDFVAAIQAADGLELVSAGVVTLSGAELGFTSGLLLRDPDGHVLQLVEP